MAPTLYSTDQFSPNVTPGHVYLTLDWRNVPDESHQEIVAKAQALLDSCLSNISNTLEYQAKVSITSDELTTYTGVTETYPIIFPSYLLPDDNRYVRAAHSALLNVLGRDDGLGVWRFATDGGHLMAAGIPTIGFGPGDDTLAHTNQERVSLPQMEEALTAYVPLMLALAEESAK